MSASKLGKRKRNPSPTMENVLGESDDSDVTVPEEDAHNTYTSPPASSGTAAVVAPEAQLGQESKPGEGSDSDSDATVEEAGSKLEVTTTPAKSTPPRAASSFRPVATPVTPSKRRVVDICLSPEHSPGIPIHLLPRSSRSSSCLSLAPTMSSSLAQTGSPSHSLIVTPPNQHVASSPIRDGLSSSPTKKRHDVPRLHLSPSSPLLSTAVTTPTHNKEPRQRRANEALWPSSSPPSSPTLGTSHAMPPPPLASTSRLSAAQVTAPDVPSSQLTASQGVSSFQLSALEASSSQIPLSQTSDAPAPLANLAVGEERVVEVLPGMPSGRVTRKTHLKWLCSCSEFRFVGHSTDIIFRTCRHIKHLLGEEYDKFRLDAARRLLPDPEVGISMAQSRPTHESSSSQWRSESLSLSQSTAPSAQSTAHGLKRTRSEPAAFSAAKASHRPSLQFMSGKETKVDPPPLMLAPMLPERWLEDLAPGGWWISEKLDGHRAYWDGQNIISRLGSVRRPPPEFIKDLPTDLALDGELWGGRDTFSETSGKVRSLNSDWSGMVYFVFDCFPNGAMTDMPVEKRWEILQQHLGPAKTPDEVIEDLILSSRATSSQSHPLITSSDARRVIPLKQARCNTSHELASFFSAVINRGGEGAMLRKAGSGYYRGRSHKVMFKVKQAYDGEAVVIGYTPLREGKPDEDRTRIGSLKCRMASGNEFKVGSGLDDLLRQWAPPIGSIIKYRCWDLTAKEHKPRHPVFLGIDPDKTEPKDPDVTMVRLRQIKSAALHGSPSNG